jgi:hypothetical protein
MVVIADNLSKAGWSWGCVSAIASSGRTIWIADAHRGDGQRFIVRADEKLTAFVELESADRNLIQGDGVFIKPNIKRSTPHIPHRANNHSSRMRR